jgi:uroporphyrinogen-III decarboxylase
MDLGRKLDGTPNKERFTDEEANHRLMNPRERLLSVMRGEPTDRVPVTLFIQDQGHFLTQVYPDLDPWDALTLQQKVIEIQRQFGADVFVRVLFGLNDPLSIHMGGLNVSRQTDSWEVRTEEQRRGNTVVQCSTIRTPGGTLTQEFSRTELRPGTFVYACTRKPVQTPADLELAIRYEPGMPDDFPGRARRQVQELKRYLGDDGILGSWSPHGPFNNASLLIDQEQLYSLFLTDLSFYDRLMEFAMNRILDYARAMDAAGVDVHCVGGNVPGGFLGRRCYDQFVLPYEKRYIEFLQQNGTPAMYHNCGQVMNLVESYKALGVRIVEPFSPPPLGDADLAQVKEIVGDAYIILSGVDQVNVLQKGSVDEVKRTTERTMKIGKRGGRFIMQNVDFLEYATPPENIEAYVRTALEHADY